VAGVQAIIEKIISDAKAQADSDLEKARRQIAENEQKTEAQVRAEAGKILKQAELDCKEEERRARAIWDLAARKGALKEKRAAIAEAFLKAQEKLLSLPEEKYAAFLLSLLKKSGAEGGKIFASKKDSSYFTEAFISRAQKEISADLSLGGVRDEIKDGFVLVSGQAQINCTVDFVLNQAREELEGDVARILFGGGN
jgi:vacuolar-type H+-ATPase subunit E/Vma4